MNDAKNGGLWRFTAVVVVCRPLVMVVLVRVFVAMVMLLVHGTVAMVMTMMVGMVNRFPICLLCAVKPKLGHCISNYPPQSTNTGQDISEIILDIRINGQQQDGCSTVDKRNRGGEDQNGDHA